jgi:hypothetical protein
MPRKAAPLKFTQPSGIHGAIVTRKGEPSKVVKNLGWLMKHAAGGQVERITVYQKTKGGPVLQAKLFELQGRGHGWLGTKRADTTFTTQFADASYALEFANRRVFEHAEIQLVDDKGKKHVLRPYRGSLPK